MKVLQWPLVSPLMVAISLRALLLFRIAYGARETSFIPPQLGCSLLMVLDCRGQAESNYGDRLPETLAAGG
jgi:hypothetical protein